MSGIGDSYFIAMEFLTSELPLPCFSHRVSFFSVFCGVPGGADVAAEELVGCGRRELSDGEGFI